MLDKMPGALVKDFQKPQTAKHTDFGAQSTPKNRCMCGEQNKTIESEKKYFRFFWLLLTPFAQPVRFTWHQHFDGAAMKTDLLNLPALRLLKPLMTLAAVLALTSLPAQAVGRLADVTIVDRDTGVTLPVHYAQGEYWIAGRPGARYAIAVRNRSGQRVLAVPSVDGINVLSGDTAGWDQHGYVFSPHERYQITGWRKSDSEVAAFEFSPIANAYASRTGRPDHVGVIGVALFREQPPLPPPPAVLAPHSQSKSSQRSDENDNKSRGRLEKPGSPSPNAATAEPTARAAEASALAPQAEPSSAQSMAADSVAKAAPIPAAKLGTAHGKRETSVVTQTTFMRQQDSPNEVISIRYDSRENLVASGIIREPVVRPQVPRAFPQSQNFSYVPDPN